MELASPNPAEGGWDVGDGGRPGDAGDGVVLGDEDRSTRRQRQHPQRRHAHQPGTRGQRRPYRRRRWRIGCRDVANRECHLTVLVDRDRVVLVGPPGETAVLSAGQLGRLRAALREAAEQAGR
ncbi:hypothetical protein LX15_004290 [Streptoalloteichus tenebrarius]|uniref:Uncharacterized protein n=1 Tax=Streptoalloteichus tenebrarius (strain ATCC 17920 / DSM 40477 / JCM 4838 / CBS 697.72 / NBRC 16177 / NCIMB 11028 / NRRL B-12390 / A12253. 1 / ISP 5477) TaxID=1933 RepID=A0ABT1HYG2_STRSD|nr:hypothetical protein [Streptoalloteichus tenebrarius]MCP2260572.1 hypothetical protein [Streptoalloteichus tenebrarius]BFF01915.1 hypothetical protein GCM10020241_35900 [Streptoalloteichus tenebrarius]